MIPSSELEIILLDLYKAAIEDNLSFFADRISKESGVITIGSDPCEVWEGYAMIMKARSSRQDNGLAAIKAGRIMAFQEGYSYSTHRKGKVTKKIIRNCTYHT